MNGREHMQQIFVSSTNGTTQMSASIVAVAIQAGTCGCNSRALSARRAERVATLGDGEQE
jgi:hypothetical protein